MITIVITKELIGVIALITIAVVVIAYLKTN